MVGKFDKDIVTAQMQVVRDVSAAWKSQVLLVLLKLGIFEFLKETTTNLQHIASSLSIPQASLERLLNCAVSVGYLQKKGDNYQNSLLASKVLVKDEPGYMGNWLKLTARWYESFGKLEQAVRTNQAIEDINFDCDDEYRKLFLKGMIDYASYRGRDILNHVDLSQKKTLLDVGCGPAVYLAMFCETYPELKCTGLDLAPALQEAKEYVKNKGLENRIEFKVGNYLKDASLGNHYDIVFISHILHQENEDVCINLLEKSREALNPGGLLVIQAMFLNDDDIGPVYSSLHDLLTLLIFPGGKNYSAAKTIQWLNKVGFVHVRHQRMSLFNVNSLVLGEKK